MRAWRPNAPFLAAPVTSSIYSATADHPVHGLSRSVGDPATAPFERFLRDDPKITYVEPQDAWLRRQIIDRVEGLFGRDRIQGIYERLKEPPFDVHAFFDAAVNAANIDMRFDDAQLAKIPRTGPLVFVANHPFGVIDGVLWCNLVLKRRSNFKILIHALLCQDKDLLPHFIPIDFSGERAALETNIAARKAALDCVRNDIPLLIFPSGGISTAANFGYGRLQDRPWTTFAAKIVQQTQATVVPCFFHGQNSRLFQVASHVAEPLRMALLLNEILNKFDSTLRIDIGNPLTPDTLAQFTGRAELTEHLHDLVWQLGGTDNGD